MNLDVSEVSSAAPPPAAIVNWKQQLRGVASSQVAIWAGVTFLFLMLPVLWLIHPHIEDPDIWWHLRAGEWMLQHNSIVRFDPFSASTLGKPWAEYSWLFDVVADWTVMRADLVSLVWYEIAMQLAIAAALFTLVRSLMPHLWKAVGITVVAMFAIAPIFLPRPLAFSALFLILEIYVLLRARRNGDWKILWLLPAIFLFWANLHIEFVRGLFVLGVFCIEPLLDIVRRVPRELRTPMDSFNRRLWATLAFCVIATLINPYGVAVYKTILMYTRDTQVYNVISELRAMQFRSLTDWLVLGLAMMGCFALGRLRPFRSAWAVLLAWAAWMGFRAMREIDLLVIVSVAIISLRAGQEQDADRASFPLTAQMRFAVALAVIVALVAAGMSSPYNSQKLLAQVKQEYPLAATKYIRQNHLQGPLLNEFTWGGFLIYALPEIPVAMDGRVNVHGQEALIKELSLWNGEVGWQNRPELESANLVIAGRTWTLPLLLQNDPRFKVIYQDPVSVLFQRVDPQPTASSKEPPIK